VRGGSKSIPLKNIKEFCGKPLVFWTVKAALESEEIDEVIVSTDYPEIKQIVESFNFPKVKVYTRALQNAGDSASTESAMLEYLRLGKYTEEDLFILV